MRKIVTIIALAMSFTGAYAQDEFLSEIETFEADGPQHKITATSVILDKAFSNPLVNADNGSATVARLERKLKTNGDVPAASALNIDPDGGAFSGMDFSTGVTSVRVKVMSSTTVPHETRIGFKHFGDNGSIVYSDKQTVTVDGAWHIYEFDMSAAIIKDGEQVVGYYDWANISFLHTDTYVDGEVFFVDDFERFDPNSLSAKTNTISDLKVSPTVVVDVVNFSSSSKINKVEVYSYTGQLVTEFEGKDIKSISMSGVKAGLYILNINSDLGVKAVKVIKQ